MKFPKFPFLFLVCCLTLRAQDPSDVVKIFPKPTETRLAVADFVPRTGDTQDNLSALKVYNDILWKDLKFSGFFEIPSKSFYPITPLRLPQDVDFETWRTPSVDADYLAFDNLQVYESAVVVEAYIFDVKTRQQVIGKRYTVAQPSLVRRVAHQFADDVVFELSAGASKGVAQTKIAFTSQKGGSKEIYVMDYDGGDVRTVTANGGLNKFPEWSPDNSKLVFVTNLRSSSVWQIWIQDLSGGRAVVSAPSSYASSPSFSPDGNRIAFSSRSRSAVDSDIFVSGLDGGGLRNLTNHRGIDTSPTWSPTGQQIAFISDRSGTPQLWAMDADGANVRRLVNEGGHCDSPSWSPDGRFILYSWQAPHQYKHDIFILEVATGRIFQLTSGRGSSEAPSWSPDGRHIVFQSDRSGENQVFIMNADGKNLKQLTAYGINGSPSWSSYFHNQ